MTAAEHRNRLEASELYRRRTTEAIYTQTMARVYAYWYLDPRFRERYWVEEMDAWRPDARSRVV